MKHVISPTSRPAKTSRAGEKSSGNYFTQTPGTKDLDEHYWLFLPSDRVPN
jgi:hypothetical protein